MVSRPELGGIETMIQNVSVKHSLCTSKLATDDSLCSAHVRDVMANIAIPCSAPWPGRLGSRKDLFFNRIITADLCRPSGPMQSAVVHVGVS